MGSEVVDGKRLSSRAAPFFSPSARSPPALPPLATRHWPVLRLQPLPLNSSFPQRLALCFTKPASAQRSVLYSGNEGRMNTTQSKKKPEGEEEKSGFFVSAPSPSAHQLLAHPKPSWHSHSVGRWLNSGSRLSFSAFCVEIAHNLLKILITKKEKKKKESTKTPCS